MKVFKDVKHTNPFQLFFLFLVSIASFFGTIFLLKQFNIPKLLVLIIAVVFACVFFYFALKKKIVKSTDFTLTSSYLQWNNTKIQFKDIYSYKIHWMRGAGIVFKLTDGKKIRLSSNDNFCKTENFVLLCREIDTKLEKYNYHKIIRKKSFFETKYGYYYAIAMTIIVVSILIIEVFNRRTINSNILIMVTGVVTIWSGVSWKKK